MRTTVDDKTGEFLATGRRKAAVARVRLKKGKGAITINGREMSEYFPRIVYQKEVIKSLEVTNNNSQFDIRVNVGGGGLTGQSGAVALGIARALTLMDESNRGSLKKAGLLTRDARVVERKKYGLKKARRSEQFSKR